VKHFCTVQTLRSVSRASGGKDQQKSWQVNCIRALLLELCSFTGCFAKVLVEKFFAKHGRHAAFQEQGRKQKRAKTMRVDCIRAFLLEPCSFKGVLRNFLAGKSLQSMGATQRFKQEEGKQKPAKIMAS